MLIVDAHQDLAWNMLALGRDYTLSAAEIRQREKGTKVLEWNDDTLLGWADYQHGNVAVIFSTLFSAPIRLKEGAWDYMCYANPDQAHAQYRTQVDAYHRLVDDHPDKFSLLQTRSDLKNHLAEWSLSAQPTDSTNTSNSISASPPVGLVVLMEGAEGVRLPAELEEWWQVGVHIIGPAWAGTRFCGGTREPGPLTAEGYALLEGMADFGFVLDISHMDEKAALQALDAYPGAIIASHANAAALLKGLDSNRHLSDRVIQGLLERKGIIGVVPANGFLVPAWKDNLKKQGVSLKHLVAHIDHICQMAGNASHVGLGSDFDGGFGWQSVPAEVDTVADLQKIIPLLAEKGYADQDIIAIMGGNWLNLLHESLPEER